MHLMVNNLALIVSTAVADTYPAVYTLGVGGAYLHASQSDPRWQDHQKRTSRKILARRQVVETTSDTEAPLWAAPHAAECVFLSYLSPRSRTN